MPIRKHRTDKTAFGPASIEAMSKAFEEACTALQVYAGDEKGREIIATRIIDLARGGLIDPTALRYSAILAVDMAVLDELCSDDLIYTHSKADYDDKRSYLHKVGSRYFIYLEIT